ncbi:lipid A core - O-antigen ligase and related enzymes [Candidatus Scalindua japonica]|uniref:Lipid A core-O-antigen ligase and related enzymes n=1 Tax=Candidatus Scalindua japonica TaxID=1284222 RepID=A0A286U3J5_9BACT|nr:lipid A core - O-antigen ligase and related enzymes [Candidatus Scalindua japonica]
MIYKKHNGPGHVCGHYGGGALDYRMDFVYYYNENLTEYRLNNPHNLFHSLHSNNELQEQKIFEKDKDTE